MTSRIGSTRYLLPAATAKHAKAVAEVAQSLAGRPRIAWEMAHGDSAVPGEAPMAPLNPQGLTGTDWSGPPFGAALLMPVASFSSGTTNGVVPSSRWRDIDDTGHGITFHVWHRPHARHTDGNGALQRVMLAWSGQQSAVTSTQWRITIATPAGEVEIDRTIANTTITLYEETALVPLVPGANQITIRWQRRTSTTTLNVLRWSFLVAAKRRHGLSFPG